MKLPNDRMLLHLARDRRRAVDPQDVYFLEATGETKGRRWRATRASWNSWTSTCAARPPDRR